MVTHVIPGVQANAENPLPVYLSIFSLTRSPRLAPRRGVHRGAGLAGR